MKFNVDYIDKSEDLCHVWVEAESKEDAIQEVKHEYWDVKEIIQVCKSL